MRTKIDYGIDLGTTNSAIARMESGKPTILKTDVFVSGFYFLRISNGTNTTNYKIVIDK